MDIPTILVNNAKALIEKLAPSIAQILVKTGIKYPPQPSLNQDPSIEDPTLEFPSCLPKDELEKVATTRNNMIDQLNAFAKKTEILSKPLNALIPISDKTKSSINTLKSTRKKVQTARAIGSAAVKLIPTPPGTPGVVTSTLSDLAFIDTNSKEIIEDFLEPKLGALQSKILGITTALDYANSVIVNTSNVTKTIDTYLTNCGIPSSSLTPTNYYIDGVNTQYTKQELEQDQGKEEVYQGFTLVIVEEPFSPTVNRRKAVAKNPEGIILLETPLSFTTESQTLIDQIKLIIDSSDLKAY